MATLTVRQYLDILESGESFTYNARLSFLRIIDESVANTITADILDGNLTVNWQNGTRRSVSLTLANIDGEYNPNPYGIWVNSKFLLELGIDRNGDEIYFKHGVFVVSEPQINSTSSSNRITLNGIDKFSLLDGTNGGNLDGTYLIPVSTDVNTAIKSILDLYLDANSQFPIDAKSPKLQALIPTIASPNLDKTPYTMRTERGRTYGDVLLELNSMVSRNMYYDEAGHLVFEEDYDDSIKGSLYHYKDVLDSGKNKNIYLGSTLNYKWRELYNSVQVVGFTDSNGVIYDYTAKNDNSTSRTSIQRIGVKFLSLDFPEIYNDELAQVRAEYELKRRNAMQSSISISCVPNLSLDVDRVIEITESAYGFDAERMLITGFNLPLQNNGIMSLSAVKTEELAIG